MKLLAYAPISACGIPVVSGPSGATIGQSYVVPLNDLTCRALIMRALLIGGLAAGASAILTVASVLAEPAVLIVTVASEPLETV